MTDIAGGMVEAPFPSRPHDRCALSVNWATFTRNEQNYLKQEKLAAGGTGYGVGRTHFGLKVDANIVVTRSIIMNST